MNEKTCCAQTELDLFPPPSFETLLSDRRDPALAVTMSSRLSRGWYVKINQSADSRRLVVPVWMEHAPKDVKTALLDWALLSGASKAKHRRRAHRKLLEKYIFSYLSDSGRIRPSVARHAPGSFDTKGVCWDLAEVFDTLNRTHFNAVLSSYVRWGKHPLRSYQSYKFDGAGNRFSVITIGSLYNRPGVPRYAVEGIMFHEMLHILLPPQRHNARNVIHGRQFKEHERHFPFHDRWIRWEKSACNAMRKD
jgi:hypothetical protein